MYYTKTNTFMATPSSLHDPFETLNKAAQHAYKIVGEERGIPSSQVHRMPLCHRVAELMIEQLVTTEPGARRETRGGWTVDEHSYVDVRPSGDLIADGTWQQFVPADTLPLDTPTILIGTREQVTDVLRSYGVAEITLALWKKPA